VRGESSDEDGDCGRIRGVELLTGGLAWSVGQGQRRQFGEKWGFGDWVTDRSQGNSLWGLRIGNFYRNQTLYTLGCVKVKDEALVFVLEQQSLVLGGSGETGDVPRITVRTVPGRAELVLYH
jgi:hypothetical protein